MKNPNQVQHGARITLSHKLTRSRQTLKGTSFPDHLRKGLVGVVGVVQNGLSTAGLPGAQILGAALAGANAGGGASYGGGGGSAFASGSSGLTVGQGPVSGGAPPGGFGSSGQIHIPTGQPSINTPGTGFSPTNGQSDAFTATMQKTREFAELNASFNLQYLELQQRVQQDARLFDTVSNTMKNKHDAAKNAINNVR